MLIFIRVSVAKTMHLLSSHILPRNASDFTCSYLGVDLRNLPRGETPGPLLTKGGGGEGIKGSYLILFLYIAVVGFSEILKIVIPSSCFISREIVNVIGCDNFLVEGNGDFLHIDLMCGRYIIYRVVKLIVCYIVRFSLNSRYDKPRFVDSVAKNEPYGKVPRLGGMTNVSIFLPLNDIGTISMFLTMLVSSSLNKPAGVTTGMYNLIFPD